MRKYLIGTLDSRCDFQHIVDTCLIVDMWHHVPCMPMMYWYVRFVMRCEKFEILNNYYVGLAFAWQWYAGSTHNAHRTLKRRNKYVNIGAPIEFFSHAKWIRWMGIARMRIRIWNAEWIFIFRFRCVSCWKRVGLFSARFSYFTTIFGFCAILFVDYTISIRYVGTARYIGRSDVTDMWWRANVHCTQQPESDFRMVCYVFGTGLDQPSQEKKEE